MKQFHHAPWTRVPWLHRILFVILLLFCCYLLAGCYTERKAQKQVTKAHVRYPKVTANAFKLWFPPIIKDSVRTEYRPGATITKKEVEYLAVNCDSLMKAQGKMPPPVGRTPAQPGIVYVQMPARDSLRVDTFLNYRAEIQQSQVALEAQRHSYEEEKAAAGKLLVSEQKRNGELERKNASLGTTNRYLWIATAVLAAYTILRWVVRYFTKGRIKLP